MAKIVIFGSSAPSLINFRGDLIRELVQRGHQVMAMAPQEGFEKAVKTIGASYHFVPLHRTGLNPVKDLWSMGFLVRKLRELEPDIMISYTIKPVIYGSLAARMAGVGQVYSMITGLGYAFTTETFKQKFLFQVVKHLYRQALKNNAKVFFQNPDDMSAFKNLGLLPGQGREVLINGSGVNTSHYPFEKVNTEAITFLLIARLIWDKGIKQFIEAARLLKIRYPGVRFQILGPYDSNPSSIRREEVESWKADKSVEYLGETTDVRPYLRESSVYVLPSYYPEGTPRSILEAMAMGRPVITTDAPGCRETVLQGINGFLVPVKNSPALLEAMERFIVEPSIISLMGMKSREMVVEKYDVGKVNRLILQAMGLATYDIEDANEKKERGGALALRGY